ncbi:MAG: hypothetical protein HYR56_18305 [Acidobacteria bacterium]|nr:hypothetical protein [Acidobacteriota bacterium]MBI3425802.1 hypothetical protein [Acidobacteriota bacterium]
MGGKTGASLEHAQMTENAQVIDSELRQWLEAASEPQATAILERLLHEQVEPLIREIVGYQFRVFFDALGRVSSSTQANESEDVCSEIRVHLLTRLGEMRAAPAKKGIRNLRSYVAVTAYRACYEYLRRKYPKRYSLKNKLRFLLSQKPEFALWQSARGQWLAGLAPWQAQKVPAATRSQSKLAALLDDPQAFAATQQLTLTRDAAGLSNITQTVLSHIGQPIELDELVSVMAILCGVKDQTPLNGLPNREAERDSAAWMQELAEASPDLAVTLAETLTQRHYLQRLWAEIRQMSPRHCAALLLNLRDEGGGSATDLLVFTGVATFAELAAALALEEAELAALWPHLPLDDLTIATRLGLTRQQVINLRRSARERLWRKFNDLKF